MNLFRFNKGRAWLLAGMLAVAGPVHATAYTQTNLVASTGAYGASIVDPTLINAWGIAIRPAGFGGHFWVESAGAGTSNQFVGDVGGTPLHSDNLRLVTIPGPSNPPVVTPGDADRRSIQSRSAVHYYARINYRAGKVPFRN